MGSIVFVHGTGVRIKGYLSGLENAKKIARSVGIEDSFIDCAWGDPLGIEFDGYSLPDPPTDQKLRDDGQDFARWSWLFDDPLFELDKLTIRDTSASAKHIRIPGVQPKWEGLWETIAAYKPSDELKLLLVRGGFDGVWTTAWSEIIQTTSIPRDAFEVSSHELAEATRALARAVIAQIHVSAVAAGMPGPSRVHRDKLFERLLVDWKQEVYGISDFFTQIFKRAATNVLRKHRNSFCDAISLQLGDVLLYQSRGQEVRNFIRSKIEKAEPPVTVIAHSLGGIACVDLLALSNPPAVKYLVTAGSQSPLFCEIGALASLKRSQPLPDGFPFWLNLYDRNDFLSFVAHRIWPKVTDMEVESGQPFPDSHSAYFGNEIVWQDIREFIAK